MDNNWPMKCLVLYPGKSMLNGQQTTLMFEEDENILLDSLRTPTTNKSLFIQIMGLYGTPTNVFTFYILNTIRCSRKNSTPDSTQKR